jgi:hypothetical protein
MSIVYGCVAPPGGRIVPASVISAFPPPGFGPGASGTGVCSRGIVIFRTLPVRLPCASFWEYVAVYDTSAAGPRSGFAPVAGVVVPYAR